jgi:putative membrane protein insertion efficiency factor
MNSTGRSRVSPVAAVHSVYKRVLSPLLHAGAGMLGGACRFQPTCSEYANIAIHEYGLLHGGWMALKRLLRCHPGCAGGYDPVPPKSGFTHTRQSQLP